MTGLRQVESVWQRFGSLINTGLLIGGVLMLLWRGGAYMERTETRIETNATEITRVEREQNVKWQEHSELHKNRLADVKSVEARNDERFKSVESDVRKLVADTSNLTYRMTTNEQATSGIAETVKEIQKSATELSGDMREIKVILQRIEKGQLR